MDFQNSRGSVWRKWDLHLHSNASDGKSTPLELVEEAVKKNISVIALTDHHTVKNIDGIKAIGKENGINVISGIEFRTEYGQKSVHMIGLFPDVYNGTVLNQKTLYERILCKLDLSESDIIDAARKTGKQFASDDAAYREGLLLVQVDFKKAADLIHKNGGLVTVHAGSKTNSLDEEMRHEGKKEKNVALADSLGPVKEELLRDYIDICEVRTAKEAPFYLNTFQKPSIAASDAHNISEFARHFTWIKAEPTFEGLRQILFEPKNRVKIQQEEPEPKSDYLVIDSISLEHKDFGKQTIPFNQGLNTIIGGRSSGKSILLGCIAKLCGENKPIKESRPEYDAYIDDITKHMSIIWRDRTAGGNRKIDYFPQSKIIDVASNPKEISKLAISILQSNSEFSTKISEARGFAFVNEQLLHSLFSQYKAVIKETETLHAELLGLGNKEGISKEIEKIQAQMNQIKASMAESMSEEEEDTLTKQKNTLTSLRVQCAKATQNVAVLRKIHSIQLMMDISSQLYPLDDQLRNIVDEIYKEICKGVQISWGSRIEELIAQQEQDLNELDEQIRQIESSEVFLKAQSLYSKNKEYTLYSDRLEAETKRYEAILRKENEIDERNCHLEELKTRLMQTHSQFRQKCVEFCEIVHMEKEGIRIQPYIEFRQEQYSQLVSVSLDGRSSSNLNLTQYHWKKGDDYTKFVESAFIKLYEGEYVLRKGFSLDAFAEQLITFNAFEIKYNIIYQGDDLNSMSEGKMAFVVLRLLLDFSDSDYPILIDQPEDDLDNRAIYSELVEYLRSKKEKRQIILVTHNPNIVVGADAEEIIVANQHGVNSPNPYNTKFVYRSGPLEESFKKKSDYILLRQGIREHVCDLLEGGDDAFRVRENKYQL